jgi:hypothetical protein
MSTDDAAAKRQKRAEKRKDKAAKGGKAGKAGKAAKAGKAGGKGEKKKDKNPVLKEAKSRYMDELRKQGVAEDQMEAKVKTHLDDVVKPAMSEARAGAKAKNLKGPERKKFIRESVRSKLGLQA